VLVLTTHYMDEADLLADRIAVMNLGKLQCCGSSLFLKSRFGLGYTLSMVVADGKASDAITRAVHATLRRHVPEAQVLSAAGDELSFRLPFSDSPRFAALLAELERSRAALGIGSYGMSVTSMEEVFLRLAQGDEALAMVSARKAMTTTTTDTYTVLKQDLDALEVPPVLGTAIRGAAKSPEGKYWRKLRSYKTHVVLLLRWRRSKSFRPTVRRLLGTAFPGPDDEMARMLPEGVEFTSVEKLTVGSETSTPPPSPPSHVVAPQPAEMDISPPPKGEIDISPPSKGAQSRRARPSSSSLNLLSHLRGSSKGSSTRQAIQNADGPKGHVTDDELHAAPSVPPMRKQLFVMLLKRWTCLKRNKKGFFTQQILPVGLVAVILLILTLEDPRVGPPLRMHASIYRRTRWGGEQPEPPTLHVANRARDTELFRHYSTYSLDWQEIGAADSYNLSQYLLETYNDHQSRATRLGGAFAGDMVHFNLYFGGGGLEGVLLGNGNSSAVDPEDLAALSGGVAVALLTCSRWQPGGVGLVGWTPGIVAQALLPSLNLSASTEALVMSLVRGANGTLAGLNVSASGLAGLAAGALAGSIYLSNSSVSNSSSGFNSSVVVGTAPINLITVALATVIGPAVSAGLALGAAVVNNASGAAVGAGVGTGPAGDLLCAGLGQVSVFDAELSAAGVPVAARADGFATANPADSLGSALVNGQPLREAALELLEDSAGRAATVGVGFIFDSITYDPWLPQLRAALDPITPLLVALSCSTYLCSLVRPANEQALTLALRAVLVVVGGWTSAEASSLITVDRVRRSLPYIRVFNILVTELEGVRQGNEVRLHSIENFPLPLADLAELVALIADVNPTGPFTALRPVLDGWAADGAPLTIPTTAEAAAGVAADAAGQNSTLGDREQLNLRQLTLRLGMVWLGPASLKVNHLELTAVGTFQASSSLSSPPSPPPPPPPGPMRLTIGHLELSDSVIAYVNLSYADTRTSGSAAGFTYDARVVPSIYTAPWLNVSLPVQLTVLHNTSSAHAMAVFLGEASQSAWYEAHAAMHPPPPPHLGVVGDARAPIGPVKYEVFNAPLPLTRRAALEVWRTLIATDCD
jgi:hypothetical protein